MGGGVQGGAHGVHRKQYGLVGGVMYGPVGVVKYGPVGVVKYGEKLEQETAEEGLEEKIKLDFFGTKLLNIMAK